MRKNAATTVTIMVTAACLASFFNGQELARRSFKK